MSVVPASNDAANEAPHAAPNRHLRIPGTRNLRDVGGYPAANGRRTRWRTLYRTDSLDRLPPESQSTLLDLGLRQVIDLRWPHELVEAPSVFGRSKQVRYFNVSLWEENPPTRGPIETYSRAFDTRAHVLAAIVRSLLEPDGVPAVIGCAAGVDRTGVSIALLLSAVGVPNDVVAADYGLSVETYASVDSAPELSDDWRAGSVSLDCLPEYMLEALDHLDRRHGGARALLAREGLRNADLDRLTQLLTERVAA
jgi:protein-tyrosine phosphatase